MMPSRDYSPANGHSFNNIPISNSQNVHVGDNHVYNDPHGLDTDRLAEALRRRPQSINRRTTPELDEVKTNSPEAEDVPVDYDVLPDITGDFPLLESLMPNFETSHGSAASLALHFVNKLRIKSISDPLDTLICDSLKERLSKVRTDLHDARRLSEGSHRRRWKRAMETGVEIAITKCNTAMLDLFLDYGANINGWRRHKDTLHETPLLFAIGTGNLDMVNELIQRGADVQMRSGPADCPLKAAVLLDCADIAKTLVRAGAEILDAAGEFDNSLLAAASLASPNGCLKALLKQLSSQELAGGALARAAVVALDYGNSDGARLLLETARSLQEGGGVSLNLSGLLECAAYFNSTDAVLVVLHNPAPVSARELQMSLETAAAAGSFDVLDMLLRHSITVPGFLHPDQQAALSLAVQKRDRVFAHYFSAKGSYVYVHDHRASALRFSVRQGSLDFVRLLIQQGAPKTCDGESVIRLATETGHGDIAMHLIHDGASLDPPGIAATLEYAAKSGKLDIIEALVQNGAAICFPEHDAALQAAVLRGDVDIVAFLVRNGTNSPTAGDSTLLEDAARQGYLEIVQFLVREGFEITREALANAIQSGDDKTVRFLLETKPSVMGQENKNEFLTMAVERQYGPTTVTIAEHGARTASDCESALQIAVRNGDATTVKYLVGLGAPVTDELAETAAAGHQYHATVFLLEHGAALRQKNRHLEQAVRDQDRRWAKLLLENDADSNYVSSSSSSEKEEEDGGRPLLSMAVAGGDTAIAALLLDHGARMAAAQQCAFLRTAMDRRDTRMLKFLREQGAVFTPAGGAAALARAVTANDEFLVRECLKAGADPNQRDKTTTPLALSPLGIAAKNRNAHLIGVLLKHGADPNDGLMRSSSACLEKALNAYGMAFRANEKADAARCVKLLLNGGALAENLWGLDKDRLDQVLGKQQEEED